MDRVRGKREMWLCMFANLVGLSVVLGAHFIRARIGSIWFVVKVSLLHLNIFHCALW
jgi:hypothetical protein